MDPAYHQVADILLELEQALRRIGLWEAERPSPDKLRSTQPFAIDTLTFPQWLQFIFVERMGQILEKNLPLPNVSGIQPMAEEYFKDAEQDGTQVVAVLQRFDDIIQQHH